MNCMKTMACLLSVLILSGCMTPVQVKDPKNLTTKEIVAVLKHESIDTVSTSHSNRVWINLTDGREYEGVYNPHDIPKFAKDKTLHDASNFVAHMQKKRLLTTWEHICE
jgi:hypothetical protein